MLNDRYYHAARAAEERRVAMASSVLKARAIHLELANRYDALVEGEPLAQVQAAEDLLKAGSTCRRA
jgi:hypothetical protein